MPKEFAPHQYSKAFGSNQHQSTDVDDLSDHKQRNAKGKEKVTLPVPILNGDPGKPWDVISSLSDDEAKDALAVSF